jgi:hypothetical protein
LYAASLFPSLSFVDCLLDLEPQDLPLYHLIMDGDISRVTGLLRVGDKQDGRVQMKNQIAEYTDLFDATGADTRKNKYTDVVNKYYDLATDFYEFGWGSSFHFAPRHKWESLQSSIERHELWLSNRLGLTESHTVIGIPFKHNTTPQTQTNQSQTHKPSQIHTNPHKPTQTWFLLRNRYRVWCGWTSP